MFTKFFRQVSGEPIKATTINAPLDAIETAMGLAASAPLSTSSINGARGFALASQEPFWAKINSGTGTGPYTWTEQIPAASGTWTTGYLTDNSGADPAYNTIAVTPASLPVIVEIRRNGAGVLVFTAGTC